MVYILWNLVRFKKKTKKKKQSKIKLKNNFVYLFSEGWITHFFIFVLIMTI